MDPSISRNDRKRRKDDTADKMSRQKCKETDENFNPNHPRGSVLYLKQVRGQRTALLPLSQEDNGHAVNVLESGTSNLVHAENGALSGNLNPKDSHSFPPDPYLSKDARNKRKYLMAEKRNKQRSIKTGVLPEYLPLTSPSFSSPSPLSGVLNPSPSDCCFLNSRLSQGVLNSDSLTSLGIPSPSPILRGFNPSGSHPFSTNPSISKDARYKRKNLMAEKHNNQKFIEENLNPNHKMNSVRQLRQDMGHCSDVLPLSHGGVIESICFSSASLSSPSLLSEVVNPSTSDRCRTRSRLSEDVLRSLSSYRLDFGREPDSPGNNEAQRLHSEIYEKVDNEACLYLGDPSIYCSHCKARFWFDERSDKSKSPTQPEFSICCMKGKVQLPFLQKPPELLFNLMTGEDYRSSHFLQNLRAYNSMFAFTSIGGTIDNSVNDGGGPPQFILSGQNYHRIGSLLPQPGCKPKFAQLYIYDTNNELLNRVGHFRPGCSQDSIDSSLVEDLTIMVDEFNVLAQSFRRVRNFVKEKDTSNFFLRLFRNRSNDARVYNLPTSEEVAALIVGDSSALDSGRDVIVKKCSGELCRLHETHTAFLPLQYPLLFPYGEDGYQEDIPIRSSEIESQTRKRIRVSLREFIAFRIQERDVEFGNVVNTRRLFQQFLVDSYTMIESQRLSYIRANQKVIRSEVLSGLQEAVTRGETESSFVGKRIILPASFTGGTRYMFNNCQDAMAVCKKYGYPDLFITFTCNTNWKEINDFVLSKGLKAADRPDIVSRVFKIKLDHMLADFKKGKIFGQVDAGMYTVEFQKRGLPHAHILLWLNGKDKLKTGTDIDEIISAELPDPVLYPRLHDMVCNYMMHGPCGVSNRKSPCMKDGKCSKFYPKKFQDSTCIDEDGYPIYRRRNSGLSVQKKGTSLDNRSVVPYNPYLLMRYGGHVNVEYCNKTNSIKYLFKYVNKGPDRATIEIFNSSTSRNEDKVVDEIKQFYDCRYLSPCEAVWRIFAFDIHHKWPPVQRLSFHLPNEQSVIFNDSDSIDEVVSKTKDLHTMFQAWFQANRDFNEGRSLTYAEFPEKFVYLKQQRKWQPRKQGQCIGRLTYIPPGSGELYYLRILLTIQKGCTDFRSLRTVNGIVYNSYHEACYALGLLADDKEYIDAITEASDLGSGYQLRRLFVTLLVMNSMSKPNIVWNSTWRLLCDGIVYDRRKNLNMPDLTIQDNELQNLCLIELEKLLQSSGRSLSDFDCMPLPNISGMSDFENRFIVDELSYNIAEQEKILNSLLKLLTPEQSNVYDKIMNAVLSELGGFFFLYGYGGTGKTFLWRTLSAGLRSKGFIVLNVASSGIASLLLPGGKTAHSTFCIPLVVSEESTCNIKQGSLKANLLLHTKLIIWDEAPMLNRFCFEALDRTLRDIMRAENIINMHKPFGGKVIVLGGDFRQILPVIRKGSRQDITGAAINSSEIWKHCKVLRLTVNMRLSSSSSSNDASEIKKFADWILAIGDGDPMANENGESEIEIPPDLLISECDNPLLSLIQFAYPDIVDNMRDSKFFEERAILAPTLDSVEEVNNFVLSLIPGDEKEYLSSDSICQSDEDYDIEAEWFTPEFLNEIKCSGIPNHRLKLKVGVPVMLMRNIDQAAGLCNGTRVLVNELGRNVIGATILTGKNVGDKIFIARMDMIPSDPGLPFKFRRRQFRLCLCFTMTINKSQGQSLSHVGLYLPRPVFTHGQLYVAMSRVKSRKGLKILILDKQGYVCASTKNVVYREVLQNV